MQWQVALDAVHRINFGPDAMIVHAREMPNLSGLSVFEPAQANPPAGLPRYTIQIKDRCKLPFKYLGEVP